MSDIDTQKVREQARWADPPLEPWASDRINNLCDALDAARKERDEANAKIERLTSRGIEDLRHENGELRAALARLRAAAEKRLARGCNDTCSKALIDEYACDCGDHALRAALAEVNQ